MTGSAAAGSDRQVLSTRHILAATMGNGLEFYDFITYAFFAIDIGKAFFPAGGAFASLMLSLATFGAGFLTRPLGAAVIGRYADKVGRRPAMVLSFSLMGLSVMALALIPPYAAIGVAAPILAVLARLVQGFALGGEVGPNVAYLAEAAPPLRRGLVVCLQGVSQSVASLAGALVGLLLTLTLSAGALEAYGWRIAFLIGVLTLPAGLILRRRLPETLHLRDAHAPAPPPPRRQALIIGLCFLSLSNATIATYVKNYMTTYAQASLHMGAQVAFAATVVPTALSIVVGLWGGWLSDRIGRRPVIGWARFVGLVASAPLFYWMVAAHTPLAVVGGAVVLALIDAPASAALYAAMSESLPKASRGRSVALTYALAIGLFGGTAQLVITWLIHVTGNLLAPAWYLTAANLAGVCAALFLPESAPIRTQAAERLRSAA